MTVTFTGVTNTAAVKDINAANIPGVVASTFNNLNLVLQSTVSIANNNIIIGSNSSAKNYFGINVFDLDQRMTSNSSQTFVDFGNKIFINDTADSVLIGASTATNSIPIRFDYGTTTFDAKSTSINNTFKRSGNAYLYEYQSESVETAIRHGKMFFTQSLAVNSLITDSLFSTGIAMTNNWIMVSALKDANGAGSVYSFYNKTGNKNWSIIRQAPTKQIDTKSIKRMYLYNNNTKSLITDLPILSPENGLPVVSAAEQIRYITNYDPAIYTDTPNTYSFAADPKKAWGVEHVGELWWDTNALKYVDWNQGTLLDKLNNWGLTFPNSFVNIYEWIESDLTPSQYAKSHLVDGPTYTVSDVFTTKTVIDPSSLISSTKYYFWVRNSSVNNLNLNRLTAVQLQGFINNPRNTNLPFAAIIGTNALALFNCQDIINADTNLNITLTTDLQANPVHEEWSMFDDGSDLGIAKEFLDRLRDSLAGEDQQGKLVPDPSLTEKEKYGLNIRPRQTTFIDNFSAKKMFMNETKLNKYFVYPQFFLTNRSKKMTINFRTNKQIQYAYSEHFIIYSD